jgi:hypothetical protein
MRLDLPPYGVQWYFIIILTSSMIMTVFPDHGCEKLPTRGWVCSVGIGRNMDILHLGTWAMNGAYIYPLADAIGLTALRGAVVTHLVYDHDGLPRSWLRETPNTRLGV